MSNLSQSRICVQRFHAMEHMHNHISKSIAMDKVQRAIFLKDNLWDLGTTITISFMETDSPPSWYDIAFIEKEARAIGEKVDPLEYKVRDMPSVEAIQHIVTTFVAPEVPGLTLTFVPNGGMLRVRLYASGGSSSLVGTQSLTAPADEHTITFGWLDIATIVHEFSHAMGMLHEHQNPRGGIIWNKPVVYAWAQETQGWDKTTTDLNILDKLPANEITNSAFDPKSIMLYFFPASFTLNNIGTQQNLHYSETDKTWLNASYPAEGPRHVPVGDDNGSTLGDGTTPEPKEYNYWPIFIFSFAMLFVVLVYLFWTSRQEKTY